MIDDQPTRSVGEGDPSLADVSSLKGLTRVLGLEPAQPGHDPLLGCDIGGVTIVKLIAEGGMGRVYEGKQGKPSRTVAVKVMRPGLASPSLLKRFEYEAEVLGRLQHPGIAHIYSVGVHHLGNATVPYFVMEYIASARTLTKYADDLKLPTRQRLDLFRSVCDAVAHGHQKGVIHRDLKPSNILVDATGQPKVIDFGVARATDSDMALTTMQTDVGQLIGTLQYMSPEQFDADPNDIDIRSDVYALGVILYELLAGKPPYDVRKKAVLEVMRIVKEEDPTPLSALNRGLRGDAAVITGKCLEKDRGKRYSSASEIGSDIGRYLAGEPISASPPSFIDGLTRLARRHRSAAATLAGVFAALVLAVVGIGIFARRAEQQRRVAVASRTLADAARKTAEQEQQAAERSRRLADENASAARAAEQDAQQKLYVANMLAIDSCLRDGNLAKATELCQRNQVLLGDQSLPIELRCANAALDNARAVFMRPGVRATQVDITADANLVAVAFDDGVLQVWKCGNAEPFREWNSVTMSLKSVKFRDDGDVVEVMEDIGNHRRFSVPSGTEVSVATPPPVAEQRQRSESVLDAELSTEGLATVRDRRTNAVISTAKFEDMHPNGEKVAAVSSSPDGSLLAIGTMVPRSQIRRLRVFDPMRGQQRAIFEMKFLFTLGSVVFHPAGDLLVVLGKNNVAYVYRVSTGKQAGTLIGHSQQILCAAFTPDGSRLVTGSRDGTVRTWDPERCVQTGLCVGHTAAVTAVAINSAGAIVSASTDGAVRVWQDGDFGGVVVVRVPCQLKSACFSPDGTRIAVVTLLHGVWIVNSQTGEIMQRLEREADEGARGVAFTADGRRIAVIHENGEASVWDGSAGRLLVVCERQPGFPRSVAISADGSMLVSGFNNPSRAVVWDMDAGKLLASTEKFSSNEIDASAVFGLEGQRVATGSPHLWNSRTGQKLATLSEAGSAYQVAASRDGRLLATGGYDGITRVWDFATGTQIASLVGHEQAVYSLHFSPDGEFIATGGFDTTVRLWRTRTGEAIHVLKGHNSWVGQLAFSPNGQRLVSGGRDNMARIWDVASGDELFVLRGHSDYVGSIAFSSDGTRLVTCSHDGTARLWGVRPADLRAIATHEE
jgi:WD40 repeat protein/tRNA A-37 threonylcarbamoyl transferase component Bud32